MKKQIFKFSLVALTVAATISCKDDKVDPVLSVTPSVVRNIVFSADGTIAKANGSDFTPTLTVNANVGSWDAISSDPEWLKVVNKQATTFTLSAEVNTSLDSRGPVTVTVTAGAALPVVINVTQEGATPTLLLSSTTAVVFTYDGNVTSGTDAYTVTTNYSGWNAVSSQKWLTVNVNQSNKSFTLEAHENEELTSRSAIVTVSAGTATPIELHVSQEGNPGGVETLPPSAAASTQTWTVISDDETIKQVWSDYIMYDGDKKVEKGTIANFVFGTDPDYCDNPGYDGYLYNWYYVVANETDLCPSPWRVPTGQDFIDLNLALGGPGVDSYKTDPAHAGAAELIVKYVNLVGFKTTGRVNASGRNNQGTHCYIYSSEDMNKDGKGKHMFIDVRGEYYPEGSAGSAQKTTGMAVRCVRDAE